MSSTNRLVLNTTQSGFSSQPLIWRPPCRAWEGDGVLPSFPWAPSLPPPESPGANAVRTPSPSPGRRLVRRGRDKYSPALFRSPYCSAPWIPGLVGEGIFLAVENAEGAVGHGLHFETAGEHLKRGKAETYEVISVTNRSEWAIPPVRRIASGRPLSTAAIAPIILATCSTIASRTAGPPCFPGQSSGRPRGGGPFPDTLSIRFPWKAA